MFNIGWPLQKIARGSMPRWPEGPCLGWVCPLYPHVPCPLSLPPAARSKGASAANYSIQAACLCGVCTVRHTVNCTLYTVLCTLYTVHYIFDTVHFTLYTVHCTLYTVHYMLTLYTIHCQRCDAPRHKQTMAACQIRHHGTIALWLVRNLVLWLLGTRGIFAPWLFGKQNFMALQLLDTSGTT